MGGQTEKFKCRNCSKFLLDSEKHFVTCEATENGIIRQHGFHDPIWFCKVCKKETKLYFCDSEDYGGTFWSIFHFEQAHICSKECLLAYITECIDNHIQP